MTQETSALSSENDAAEPRRAFPVRRTLVWLGIAGIAGASAALTFFVLRETLRREPPSDETTARIQDLIDEANRLIKTLDEKKQA